MAIRPGSSGVSAERRILGPTHGKWRRQVLLVFASTNASHHPYFISRPVVQWLEAAQKK